jgi:hypothetical protein
LPLSVARFATSREVRYDPELGQLVFSPLAEQAQLRGDVLTRMGATTVAPGAELQLSKGWPRPALRQAEVMIQLELPSSTSRISLTLRDAGSNSSRLQFLLDYTPPELGRQHTAVVSAVCASGHGCATVGGGVANDTLSFRQSDKTLSLRLFTDQQLSELYWQGGRSVFTIASYLSQMAEPTLSIGVAGSEALAIRSVRAWTVGGIWVGTEEVLKARPPPPPPPAAKAQQLGDSAASVPPAWILPRYHNSPPCLQQVAPHDIAAALTTADGRHHVWQFCTRADNGNCTTAISCPFGRQWTHSSSEDYVHWTHHGESIGVYSGFVVVDERGYACAGQRCPNSVLHGSNGQWNCPYLQIGGGGLNGSMSDGTDVPLWLSCADSADPAMRWQNHSYLLNPHYYRQVAYDASAWRVRDEWNILVAADACNSTKQHPCPAGFRWDLWTTSGALRSSDWKYRGPIFSTNCTVEDGCHARGEAITPSFSCGLPGGDSGSCLLTNNGPGTWWLGRMMDYRFVDSKGSQAFRGDGEQGVYDGGDTFGMPRVLADTAAVHGPVSPAGRRVMIGSVGGGAPSNISAGAAQSLPRDLSIAPGGGLRLRFVPELHALRAGAPLAGAHAGFLQMEVVATFALGQAGNASLMSLFSGRAIISASAAEKTWSVTQGLRVFTAPLPLDSSGTVQFHAYADGSFLEMNANNATMISTTVKLPDASATGLSTFDLKPLSLLSYRLNES